MTENASPNKHTIPPSLQQDILKIDQSDTTPSPAPAEPRSSAQESKPSAGAKPTAKSSKKLQPSLQAWMASRNIAVGGVCNVGASEPEQTKRSARAGYTSVQKPNIEAGPGHNRLNLSDPVASKTHGVKSAEGVQDNSARAWQDSLRSASDTEHDRSTSSRRSSHELTVPYGPRLRTARRARSRSASSSVSRGLESECGTPSRAGSSTPRRKPLTQQSQREQIAVAQHYERVTNGRTPSASPARGKRQQRGESPSPAHSIGSERGTCTPTRQAKATSSAPATPLSARMERLAQQRTPSEHCPGTTEIREKRLQSEMLQLQKLKILNESTYRSILANPETPKQVPCPSLTVPTGPELRTARRAASRGTSRSRSTTPQGSTDRRSVQLTVGMPPREQVAIERHLERMHLAEQAELSEPSQSSAREKIHVDDLPANKDLDEWIGESVTAEERADRRGVVARLREKARQEQWEKDHADLLRPLNALNRAKARSKNTPLHPPADCDREDWIKEAATVEDRAKRMGIVGRCREKERQDQWEKDNAKLLRLVNGPNRTAGHPKMSQPKPGAKPHCVLISSSIDATADTLPGETIESKSLPSADNETSPAPEASSSHSANS